MGLALQGYDFTVIHRKGVVNSNADALSRREYEKEEEPETEYHDSLVGGGHQGFDRTDYAIKSKFYWNWMYADVDKYVRQCKECQYAKCKLHGQPAPLHPLAVAAVFQLGIWTF